MLEKNPEEERRLRKLYEARASSSYNEQLKTPSLSRSFHSQHNDITNHTKDIDVDEIEQDIPQRTIAYRALKAIVFVLFMIYWVVSEPIIRSIAFMTMVSSAVVFDPIRHVWSNLTIYESLIRHKKKLGTLITLIVLGLCMIPVPFYAKPYFEAMDIPRYRLSKHVTDLKKNIETITADNLAMKSLLEKIQHTEIKNIWDKLEDHQTQINRLQNSIDEKIKLALESKLPDMILVQTNKKGDLEFSPKFYAYLQDAISWDNFLLQNNQSITKYLSGFFEQQEKQGAIVGKNTFMKLISNALIHHQNPIVEDAQVSFDDLINNALQQYHQDVLNTADFALESRGARVLTSLTSPTYYATPSWILTLRSALGLHVHVNPPKFAITTYTHAGECWSMLGNHGNLTIKLSEPINVQGITVEFPSSEVMLGKMSSAPKDIELYGLSNYSHSKHPTYLGKIQYDINKGSPIQTFDLVSSPEISRGVIVKVLSNWGSQEKTDIYRIRIHGTPS